MIERNIRGVPEPNRAVLDVHARHLALDEGHVLLSPEQRAAFDGDICGRQRRRRHLLEQRLEQMMVGAIDQ
jgi:hypothetical protein